MNKYFIVPERLYYKLKGEHSEQELRELAGLENVSPSLQKHIEGEGINNIRNLSGTQNKPFASSEKSYEQSQEPMDLQASSKRKREASDGEEDIKRKRYRLLNLEDDSEESNVSRSDRPTEDETYNSICTRSETF
jgi:DNA polymerase II large subunit